MTSTTASGQPQTKFDLSFARVVDTELTRLGRIIRWLNLADKHLKRAAKGLAHRAPAQGGGPAVRHPAGPHADDGGVPIRRGIPRWAWRVFWPTWHEELLAVALIIMTVAVGWLLARP